MVSYEVICYSIFISIFMIGKKLKLLLVVGLTI
jgi:hypothetical protein